MKWSASMNCVTGRQSADADADASLTMTRAALDEVVLGKSAPPR